MRYNYVTHAIACVNICTHLTLIQYDHLQNHRVPRQARSLPRQKRRAHRSQTAQPGFRHLQKEAPRHKAGYTDLFPADYCGGQDQKPTALNQTFFHNPPKTHQSARQPPGAFFRPKAPF